MSAPSPAIVEETACVITEGRATDVIAPINKELWNSPAGTSGNDPRASCNT